MIYATEFTIIALLGICIMVALVYYLEKLSTKVLLATFTSILFISVMLVGFTQTPALITRIDSNQAKSANNSIQIRHLLDAFVKHGHEEDYLTLPRSVYLYRTRGCKVNKHEGCVKRTFKMPDGSIKTDIVCPYDQKQYDICSKSYFKEVNPMKEWICVICGKRDVKYRSGKNCYCEKHWEEYLKQGE